MTKRNEEPGRVPPHNLDAERALLGAALLSPSALEVLATQLEPEDFYQPGHKLIAAALRTAWEAPWKADPVTIADELRRAGLLDQVGGVEALVTLQINCPNAESAGRYASIVHDHAFLRKLIAASSEITELGYSLPDDTHAAGVRAQELLGRISSHSGARSYSTLEVADVAALLDGNLEVEVADFLTRTDGLSLFYAGKMHVLQAEPSTGKSWLALYAVLEVLLKGGSGLYLDYEDSSKGILGRLLALGADPAALRERFRYVQPAGAFGPAEKAELSRLLEQLNPDIVVIDGVAEALTREGFSEDRASEVVAWIEKLPRWLARTGAAVVMLDHVAKDPEQRGRWARGSGAKLGAVDGATYQVKVLVPFSRKKAGLVKLTIAKDRPGGVGAIGETAAVAHIEPHGDGERLVIRLEQQTEEVRPAWKPTRIMARVCELLEQATTPLSARVIGSMIHTDKPSLVREALGHLQAEGNIRAVRHGKRNLLELVRPYGSHPDSPGVEPSEPGLFDPDVVDNVTRGPWPDPDPADPDSGPLETF